MSTMCSGELKNKILKQVDNQTKNILLKKSHCKRGHATLDFFIHVLQKMVKVINSQAHNYLNYSTYQFCRKCCFVKI